MNNRIKKNLSLKNRSNKYRRFYFNQEVNLTGEFKFKVPTQDDILEAQKSNQAFLEKEKMKERILLTTSFLISIAFYFWFF